MVAIERTRTTFTRPTPWEARLEEQRVAPENSHVTGLVTTFQKILQRNGNVFTLDRQYNPFLSSEHKATASQELGNIVGNYTADLFKSDGSGDFVSEEAKQTFYNIREIAPELLKIFTKKENYVAAVHEGHLLNLAGAAIHLARYPETDFALTIGIGGSDDEFTNARLPAYGLPAFRIAENMAVFYGQRLSAKRKDVAVAKEFAGRPELTVDEKRELRQSVIPDETGKYAQLTDIDEAGIYQTYGIPTKGPRIRFVSGSNAAIAVNPKKLADKVFTRRDGNEQALKSFIDNNYPSFTKQVDFINDIPKEKLTPYGKIVIDYLATVLRKSQDPIVQKVTAILRQFGLRHGGEKGAHASYEYAAIHPLVLGDRLNLPASPFVEKGAKPPTVNFIIGGKSEKYFSILRAYIGKEASPEGLIEFLNRTITEDESRAHELTEMIGKVRRWQGLTEARRKLYTPDQTAMLVRPDRPAYEVSLISTTGEQPPYFATKFDAAIGVPVEEHMLGLQNGNGHSSEGEEIIKKGVVYDYSALVEDARRHASANGNGTH